MRYFETGEQIAEYQDAQKTAEKLSYFIGLDLGQQSDYSALVALERHGTSLRNYTFDCRFLKRWELRTSYPQIVEDTVKIVNDEQLTKNVQKPPLLAIDSTGVGAPVADLFRRAKMNAQIAAIYITSGSEVNRDGDVLKIPKRILVSTVAIALQNGTLRLSKKLHLLATLTNELENFKAKITDAGNDTFGAGADWRTGNNDDLVLSLAMALWTAANERQPARFFSQ
jgi:hypothetical protein